MSFVNFRRQKLFEAIESLDLFQVKQLLANPEDFGENWDYRDRDGRSVYAHAIMIGITQMVSTFIDYKIPLGDALLRAADICIVDIVRLICEHAKTLSKKERDAIIECHCENDDYHPCTTPLMAAALTDNFAVVKILLDMGATLKERPLLNRSQSDLTDSIVLIKEYSALASEAYISQAFNDPLDFAFALSERLRDLGSQFEDISEELIKIAAQVEQFAGEFMSVARSSIEVRTILQLAQHESVHPIAKIRAAVKGSHKLFVVHPFIQNALSDSFYQELGGKHGLMSWMLTMVALVGFPILSLWYIIFPVNILRRFLQIPYTKLYMNVGSDLTLMACVIALKFIDFNRHPIATLGLEIAVFIFCLGISCKHAKFIYDKGPRRFLAFHLSLVDGIMVTSCYVAFYIVWIGRLLDASNQSDMIRYANLLTGIEPTTAGSPPTATSPLYFTPKITQSSTLAPSPSDDTPSWLFATWNDPRVISNAVYSLVILVCVVRTFYVLSINQVGIFVIVESITGMVTDVARISVLYLFIVLAFGVGITHVSFTRWQLEYETCKMEARSLEECDKPPFTFIPASILKLYWSIYGLLKIPDLALDLRSNDSYIDFLPAFIFMFYSIATIIVLLNLLIAVMTSRFSSIESNADNEWKFARARMWLNFISDDELCLPPPFNMLPSSARICSFLTSCLRIKEDTAKTEETASWKVHSRDYKAAKAVNHAMTTRFIKYREKNLKQNPEIGGTRALLLFTRLDLIAFRNEWAEVRHEVASAEYTIEKMTLELKELFWDIAEKIKNVQGVEQRQKYTVENVGNIYDAEAAVEDQLAALNEAIMNLYDPPPRPPVEVKKGIVPEMARFLKMGKRPEDDEEFVRKRREFWMRFQNALN